MQPNTITFEELPFDVVYEVCKYLSLPELLKVSSAPLTREITEATQAHYRRFCKGSINLFQLLPGKEEFILNQIGSFIRDLTVEYPQKMKITSISRSICNEIDYHRISNLVSEKCKRLKHLRIHTINEVDMSQIRPNTKLESITIRAFSSNADKGAAKLTEKWVRSQILPSVSTLEAITFDNIYSTGASLMPCAQLKSLTLLAIKEFDLYNLLIFLKINPRLTSLSIDNSITKLKGFNFQHLAQSLKNLEKLVIECETRMAGLPTAVASLPLLTELKIYAEFGENDLNELIINLSTTNNTIKSITLAVSEDNIIHLSNKACGRLEHFTNLQTLSLKGLKVCDNNCFFENLRCITTLKNLSLSLRTDDYALYGLGSDSMLIRNVVAISTLFQLNTLQLALYPCPKTKVSHNTDKHISTDLNRMICLLAIQETSLTELHISIEKHSVILSADAKHLLGKFNKLHTLMLKIRPYDKELLNLKRSIPALKKYKYQTPNINEHLYNSDSDSDFDY